jgi:hypothetical protein
LFQILAKAIALKSDMWDGTPSGRSLALAALLLSLGFLIQQLFVTQGIQLE